MSNLEASIRETRIDRILSETDWPVESEYPQKLHEIISVISKVKNMEFNDIVNQLYMNGEAFINYI